jgi:hypothetical protein
MQFPNANEEEVQAILVQRLAIAEKLEESPCIAMTRS